MLNCTIPSVVRDARITVAQALSVRTCVACFNTARRAVHPVFSCASPPLRLSTGADMLQGFQEQIESLAQELARMKREKFDWLKDKAVSDYSTLGH